MSSGLYILIYLTIYEKNYRWVKIGISSIFFLHFFSFLYTIFSNPGIPERKYYTRNYIQYIKKEEKGKYTKCKICNIITPKSLHVVHCYYCNVCVFDHDHHCTCFGKCVAKNNCILFYISIVSIPIYAVTCFITLIAYVLYLDEMHREKRKYGRNL
jgi:hypothetical protein